MSGGGSPPAPGGDGASVEEVTPDGWATRFEHQAEACAALGSPLYARACRLLAVDCRGEGPTWEVVRSRPGLRFGQLGPLRLLGAAHLLALDGSAPGWAALLPSCGGEPPATDDQLLGQWRSLVADHRDSLVAGLDREVQTNEVGRSAGLALGLARAARSPGVESISLVELGCSAGLNLRLDAFAVDLGGVVLGDPMSPVRVAPRVLAALDPALHLPPVVDRIGVDPHPIDVNDGAVALVLESFIWPDQLERLDRLRAAVTVARSVPAVLQRVAVDGAGSAGPGSGGPGDLADALETLLSEPLPDGRLRAVMHSIVWQYVPRSVRWRVTAAVEAAGERSSPDRPLAWVRFETDEWDRRRAAVWVRTWPGGADRLVAHADFHGRWIWPVPD